MNEAQTMRLRVILKDAAFPSVVEIVKGEQRFIAAGLTKREYFAALLMAALVEKGDYSKAPESLAEGAALRADALIAALAEVKP